MKNVAPIIRHFLFAIPKARAVSPTFGQSSISESFTSVFSCFNFEQDLRDILIRKQLFFPDKRLVQFDCGKLQLLSKLLRQLKFGGHKVLIFTQMTKMLDILETFLNLHGFTYCRLDGSTKPEQRQLLMQRFNNDKKIFVFILSTRSGGFGINLTGADTVIFYDSDWNPAVDHQAQDRCHRIGQTKEVNIYRLVCEGTIEENIMKKAMQKRDLDHYAIQSGQFDTSFAEGTQNSNQPPSHKERSAHGKISRFESEFSSLKEVETYAMGVLSNEENWMLQRYSDQKLKATAMREPQIDTAGSDSETEFEQDSVLDIDGWDTVSARILYHTYS
jgi:superfamily II DNA/RNA helicase